MPAVSQLSGPGPAPLEITVDVSDDTSTVRIVGEIDLATCDQLAETLHEAIAAGPTAVLVDLRDVEHLDCGGVGVLAGAARRARAAGVGWELLPGPAVHAAVELVGGPSDIGIEPAETARSAEFDHLVPVLAELARLPEGPRRRALRERVITGYLPVAKRIARKYRRADEGLEDLEQVATLALIHAVDRFDPDRGHEFLSYAVPTINGEVRHHRRDRAPAIRMPRRVHDLQPHLFRAADELRQRNGRAPRPSELADHLGVEVEAVREALQVLDSVHCVSLDAPLGDDGDEGRTRLDVALAGPDPRVESAADRVALGPLLDRLPPRERRILLLRFFGDKTQSAIAAEVGLSQMHVSRLLSSTLAGLRRELLRDDGAVRGA